MNPINRGLVVAAVGGIALQLGLTDGMLHFLRPGMRPYLVSAGAILLALGLLVAAGGWRSQARGDADADADHDHDHSHSMRVPWLLLIPVVVGVLAPSALDSYSVARATPYQQRQYPLASFNVEQYLRAQAIAGGEPDLPLSDYLGTSRVHSNVRYLATHNVRVLGFVTPDDQRRPHRFLLTRFRISCCAADAVPLQLSVVVPNRVRIPARNHWVEVVIRLALPVTRAVWPTVDASAVRSVDKPSKPYDYM